MLWQWTVMCAQCGCTFTTEHDGKSSGDGTPCPDCGSHDTVEVGPA